MKGSALFLILVFFAFQCLAQNSRISGRVIDRTTNKALPYVHIMFQDYKLGTSTDEQGMFAFNIADSLKGELLIFTHVGYERELLKISDLETQRLVLMDALTEGLGEVMIVPVNKNRSFTYRPDWRYETVGIGNMNAALYPSTIARYYPKPDKFEKTAFLEEITVYFYATEEQKGLEPKFRIHFYDVDENGLPGKDMTQDIIVTKPTGKNRLDVALLDRKIQVPEEGFYIGLEHLFITENQYFEVKDYYINNELVAEDYRNKRYGPVYKGVFAPEESNFKVYFFEPGGWVDIRTWNITYNDRKGKYVMPEFKVKITD
ncbi:carboxypeptidase-like regulatory domain-containing protein [Christiangramia portivictoriae]|uniref:carboxypeptidase-like regulatory domain-containing protein n=1 Tax=Christiangramia portivictoriae TaxID=326069 RepID=UPI0003FF2644|nr:carboxypeptidase-like regulatory domain-containing protein [Christiangramia portivictoriae]